MNKTKDESILRHIERFVENEKDLYGNNELTETDRAQLQEVEMELDQCWDLLRQRRARREFGKDPDEAQVRPKEVVEDYEQ
jgi:Protein of unknown function (DUF2630)